MAAKPGAIWRFQHKSITVTVWLEAAKRSLTPNPKVSTRGMGSICRERC